MEPAHGIEPCLLSSFSPELTDLITEVSAAAQRLGSRLAPQTASGLAALVRVMNCYYSNLIEGHNTRPRDIERALAHDYDPEPERRDLQQEALAHVRLQRTLDEQAAAGTLPEPSSWPFIQWLHAEFYRDAPAHWLTVSSSSRTLQMEPGVPRSTSEHTVAVGRHLPPEGPQVMASLQHFEFRYRSDRLGPGQRIAALAAAHHRLNYIHPFLDGNGRVSRLMSHAMAYKAGIGSHGLWSISRGLARGLESRTDYKRMMDHADTPRRGDLDGRGSLSEQALIDFTLWFLRVCLDQLQFMFELFEFARLEERLNGFVLQHQLRPEATRLLTECLLRGELPRGDATRTTGLKERTARDVLSRLLELGILGSDTPKGPVSLRFPLSSVGVLFPKLFPET